MQALVDANTGHAPSYGPDRWTDAAVARIREVFEAPEAAVHLVTTGSAANALALATLSQPWQAVFCTEMAHIHEHECNAPEAFSGGAKLVPLPAPQAKLEPDVLSAAISRFGRDVHEAQRGPVSITQATEKGTVYSVEEIAALAAVTRSHGMKLHMDGARFTNALVRLGCTPAEMTWRAGVDALSFGGTKNGLMGVEAVILFDPEAAWELELRRKRSAHLLSKHRFLGAQMLASLENGLWLEMAQTANAMMDRLASELRALPDAALAWEPEANLVFVRLPRSVHQRLRAAGASYFVDDLLDGDPEEALVGRLVCDWSTTPEEVDAFLAVAGGGAPC